MNTIDKPTINTDEIETNLETDLEFNLDKIDEIETNLETDLNKIDEIPIKIMVLDIETDGKYTIIEIAYNIYNYNANFKSDLLAQVLCLELEKDLIINDNLKLDFYKKIPLDSIKNGLKPIEAIRILAEDLKLVGYIVCHNAKFDVTFIKRYLDKFKIKLEKFPIILDTMTSSKNFVNALNKNGGLKMPKLEELYFWLFKKQPSLDKCHRGNYDVKITAKCLSKLIEMEIIRI